MHRLIGTMAITFGSVASAQAIALLRDSLIVHRAPEIDPASAVSALTMLAGGLAVLRGRRVKK